MHTFNNKIGTINFMNNFLQFQKEIPQSRYVDEEYNRFKLKSLVRAIETETHDELPSEAKSVFLKYMVNHEAEQ
jgi:hypothetical protein